MSIEERLKELKKDELVILARELKVTGYSGLGKESLIYHIIDNYNEQDITAALNADKKKGWWERHKIAGFFIIIGFIGSIASIIGLFKPSYPNIDPEQWVIQVSKKHPIKSQEEFTRLKERVTELEAALKDGKSGNTKERKEALEALKKGNPAKAQELFKQRIDYLNLGNAYYLDFKYKEALKAYDKAIEIKPDDHEAWTNKGVALVDLGRHKEALKAYDKAIEIKPDMHKAWYNKGYALDDLCRYEEAIQVYNKAIEIKPDDDDAWTNKGVALAALGRYEEALKAYDKAIEIKPDDHKAWFNKGVALGKSGRKKEALKAYDKAIEIKPDFHEAWYNKGVALAALGRHK